MSVHSHIIVVCVGMRASLNAQPGLHLITQTVVHSADAQQETASEGEATHSQQADGPVLPCRGA
jgi:hypothetical protein